MLRSIGAVVVGYVVMAVIVIAGHVPGMLDSGLAFTPGTLDAKPAWLAYGIGLSLVAAALGGLVVRKLTGPSPARPVFALAALVVVFGLAFAAMAQFGPPPDTSKPVAEMTQKEKMDNARQPLWYAYMLPLVCAAGVVLGGRTCCRPCRA